MHTHVHEHLKYIKALKVFTMTSYTHIHNNITSIRFIVNTHRNILWIMLLTSPPSKSSSSSTNYLHTSLCPSRRSRAAAATTAPDIHPISSASHPMMIRPPHSICTPPAQAPPPKQPLCASFKSLHLLVSSPRKPPPPRSRPCLRFQPSNHKLYFPCEFSPPLLLPQNLLFYLFIFHS